MTKAVTLKLSMLLSFAGLLVAAHMFGVTDALSLESIQAHHEMLQTYVQSHPALASGLFALIYILVTALSLPGAAVMTLLAGALFPFWLALVLVSFASSIGATLAFLAARFVLRDFVHRRFGAKLEPIDRGIRQEGAFYLFALRLLPLFPFFMINILMALTPLRTIVFYGVSQLGMLPGTAVYVFAGRELANLRSLPDLISPSVLLAFALLGLLPLLARKALAFYRAQKP
ncbi:MAG TPA: TVP38/TMEM64 family protein [Rhodospirillaceae bacterium]|nr:TVP38/TMEM64 family protein [Rhodospirillaceae bacterium]